MATIDNIVADLRKAIESAKSGKTQAYDTVATVKRVAGNTAWVQIPGGTSETPVQLTIACQPGDTVQVRVGGGRAWLTGNQSAPPTDDKEAKVARKTAVEAHSVAENAQTSAGEAETAANAAQKSASAAQAFASQAENQAMSATGSANAALMQLGVVEDVIGTLSWISQHGTYDQTSDTEVVEGKFYFIQNGSEYQVVINPEGDPSAQGWYELSGVDEAVSNYVASHLSLTDAGLYVQADGIASKLLLSSDGVTIFGPNGSPIAEYGTTAKIGDPNGFHIELNPTELGFYQGQLKVAYVSNNQLYITQSVVLERMDLGTPVSQGGLGQWSWKVHEVDGMNNLYLKWLG